MTTNVHRHPLTSRLQWTGYCGLGVLAFGPAIALFVVTVVGIPLVLVTAGILLLLVAVPLTALLANGFRSAAGRMLGEPIVAAYRRPTDSGLLPLLNSWARDGARWRDLLWLLWNMTFGFVLSMVVVTLLFAIGWYALFPFLFAITPDGVFDTNYGVFVIDTQAEAFLEWAWMLVALALWWWLAPALGRARARVDRSLLAPSRTEHLERRVQTLAESRAESVDFSAAELRRVERDLHDGAQARLVALGMSLGMAEKILDGDPEAAKQWLREARTTTTSALADLRTVVRGIHPPVLADRGLVGAVQALALDLPIPVLVTVSMAGRPPAPVETAAYFAIAESLANIGRHSGAQRAWVELAHADGVLAWRSATTASAARRSTRAPGWPGSRAGSRPSTAHWRCPARQAGPPSSAWRFRASCHRRGPRPPPGRPDPAAGGARPRGRRGRRQRAVARPRAARAPARTSRSSTSGCRRRSPTRGSGPPSRPGSSSPACRCWCSRSTSSSCTRASC